ncbi:unnamed protein product [Euphydryas editha]|uniref:Regulatory protein zeste n=1 Tax=Euphydryas editha TaxID=104508 RepID=A0AAU9TGZ4_EUPED|nr:unnamed protein product [Euphydryas editha]
MLFKMESFETKAQKRERNANFTKEETDLLISLVEAKKRIIENKTSNAITWQNKEKAWKEIEKKFNSSSGSVFRDHKHLKQKYEALKRDTRRKSAVVQAELYKTGGGPSDASVLTPVEQKVKEIILNPDNKNESCYDSDSVRSNTPSSDIVQPTVAFEQILREESISSIDNTEQCSEPVRKVFIVSQDEEKLKYESKEKRPFEKLTDEKIQIANIKKNLLKEELEQKIIQRKILEKELEHKDHIYKLEKDINSKEKKPFDKLTEEKIEIASLQKKILTEELEQKLIQRKMLEKEFEHKDYIYKQEKDHILLKIKLLKKELGENL